MKGALAATASVSHSQVERCLGRIQHAQDGNTLLGIGARYGALARHTIDKVLHLGLERFALVHVQCFRLGFLCARYVVGPVDMVPLQTQLLGPWLRVVELEHATFTNHDKALLFERM